MDREENAHIVIADDQAEVRDALVRSLEREGRTATAFDTGAAAAALVEQQPDSVDLVILDLDFGPNQPGGLEILKRIRETNADVPVIILTGKGTVENAVASLRAGASDFIEKDFYLEDRLELSLEKVDRLLSVLRENTRLRAENADLDREVRYYRAEFGRRYQVVGRSPKMQQVLEVAARVASIPRPVLILGERGTGKELVAAAVHYGGIRSERPFVKVNCAALTSSLLESELFGHVKGAFTGATEARPGRFEAANGGTLFLDEVANTTPEFQQNVLRAIEYQEVQRVGGQEPIHVDVRVVAATNADLDEEMREGRFREDLYDRLRFEVIRIPPLRERREDVLPLAKFFVQQVSEEMADVENRPFSSAASKRLLAYDWPGNVRELKFAAERAACIAAGKSIEVPDLPPEVAGPAADGEADAAGGTAVFEERVMAYEVGLLRDALDACGWNQREAASRLKLSYDQFRHYYRKYGLKKP